MFLLRNQFVVFIRENISFHSSSPTHQMWPDSSDPYKRSARITRDGRYHDFRFIDYLSDAQARGNTIEQKTTFLQHDSA